MMAQKASPEIMRWMIGVATGKIKGISADLRVKVGLAVHERAYGRPPAIVAVDVALRRAVESSDPAEQLRILRDMRAAYIAEVAQLAAPVDAEYEVVEDGPPTDSDGAGDAAKESE